MENQLPRIKAKLKQLKTNDPACQLFGASKHRYKLQPTIGEEDIRRFEQRYAISLPAGYRQFLLEIGNGGAGPYYGLQSLHDGLYTDLDYRNKEDLVDPSKEFPFTAAWNMDLGDNDEERSSQLEDEYYDNKHSNGLLRLANFGCGVSINLVVNGKEHGNIWVDDRCNDAGIYPDVYFAAGPRIDFLTWYETWLDRSLVEIEEITEAARPKPAVPVSTEMNAGASQDADAAIRELHAEARRLLERRNSDEVIINVLVKKGVARHYAEMVLENVKSDRSDKKEFYKHLLLGSFALIAGMIITFGSYSIAAPGGLYLVFWGIMVGGITLIVRAVILYRKR